MARIHLVDWRHLAEQTSKEMDPKKLMILVGQLCSALDGERKQKPRLTEPAADWLYQHERKL
jgi:hypothetical protein